MLGNRIKLLREERGLKQEELAQKLSVSASAIGMYERNLREPNNELVLKIANFFEVSIDYLLGNSDSKNATTNMKKFYMCPVYGSISAGQPNWAEECIEGRIPIDYELMNIINPEEYYFLKVNGESMNNIVKNGAFALIHKQDYVENGEIAVVLVDNDNATLKHFNKQGDTIILSPDSSDNQFTMQIYDQSTSIKVIGKYVGKMEFNK